MKTVNIYMPFFSTSKPFESIKSKNIVIIVIPINGQN